MDDGVNERATEVVMLFVRAANMKGCKSNGIYGAADPFFEVKNDEGEVVARSAIFRNDLNPQWPPMRLDLEALCKGDQAREITLSFYDWNEDGEHGLLGEVTTDLQDIAKAAIHYQAQRTVDFLDKKETYDLGDGCKVFIYDLIQITGFPTAGTLIKKRIGSATPSVADTELETDSASQSSSDEDKDDAIMTSDVVSICPSAVSVASGASTVMHTNGDASPRQKHKPQTPLVKAPPNLKRRHMQRGKSLFSGELRINAMESLLPLDEEEPEEPLVAAEQRGIERAQYEVADEGHTYERSSPTGETGNQWEKALLMKSYPKATSLPKPQRFPPSPIRSRIDLKMKGANRRARVPGTSLCDESTPSPLCEANVTDWACSQRPVASSIDSELSENPYEASPSYRHLPEELFLPVSDDSEGVSFQARTSPLLDANPNSTIGLVRCSDLMVKTKQSLDRPKKEYLSH